MKRRITFVGRGGTVLITMGLALLLVSRIPSDSIASAFLCTHVPPKVSQRANLLFYSSSPSPTQPSYEILLTPQEGLRILIWSNSTIDVYILEISSQIFTQWLGYDILNVTDLEDFLEANPSLIGWSGEVNNGHITHEYVPTKVTNATLVVSNPSSEIAHVDVDVTHISRLARIKAQNLGQWATPIGFVFSLPWLTQLWKKKTRRKLS